MTSHDQARPASNLLRATPAGADPNPRPLIATIEFDSLQPCETLVTAKTGHKVIASFNVASWPAHAMYIPGGPAIFQPPAMPAMLERKQDTSPATSWHTDPWPSGTSRSWKPMETLAWKRSCLAIQAMSPDFRFDDIDVAMSVTHCRGLLAMCTGAEDHRCFYQISLVHNILVVNRVFRRQKPRTGETPGEEEEKSPDDSHPTQRSSFDFGKYFESKFRKWPPGLENSYNHVRHLQYDLGQLKCLIGVGVDATIHAPVEMRTSGSSQAMPPRSFEMEGFQVVLQGANPNTSAAEMKTKRQFRQHEIDQVWFSRTANLIHADMGLDKGKTSQNSDHVFVRNVKVEDTSNRLHQWENVERNQLALRKLNNTPNTYTNTNMPDTYHLAADAEEALSPGLSPKRSETFSSFTTEEKTIDGVTFLDILPAEPYKLQVLVHLGPGLETRWRSITVTESDDVATIVKKLLSEYKSSVSWLWRLQYRVVEGKTLTLQKAALRNAATFEQSGPAHCDHPQCFIGRCEDAGDLTRAFLFPPDCLYQWSGYKLDKSAYKDCRVTSGHEVLLITHTPPVPKPKKEKKEKEEKKPKTTRAKESHSANSSTSSTGLVSEPEHKSDGVCCTVCGIITVLVILAVAGLFVWAFVKVPPQSPK
ncbi:Uu.00g010330.m01.CDS01 [Anthostomella pinea]|uniref:Uu.00g010330.m01.CDS01 n=1 Tax=Anthostomella pinea TaxID=933095 RepID=A0AAI8VY82_9PEZI|nr:Uu.00g010330.m01.CDS01 [Anthostomella pinea]